MFELLWALLTKTTKVYGRINKAFSSVHVEKNFSWKNNPVFATFEEGHKVWYK